MWASHPTSHHQALAFTPHSQRTGVQFLLEARKTPRYSVNYSVPLPDLLLGFPLFPRHTMPTLPLPVRWWWWCGCAQRKKGLSSNQPCKLSCTPPMFVTPKKSEPQTANNCAAHRVNPGLTYRPQATSTQQATVAAFLFLGASRASMLPSHVSCHPRQCRPTLLVPAVVLPCGIWRIFTAGDNYMG